ncbi:uncharacterized protein [Lepisosteus oculatus]|uniref:uncharacterized protein isoform X2 n=1 Tax=Lepisosteus oculatus TaxID=7918 RepID=UPI0035F514A9
MHLLYRAIMLMYFVTLIVAGAEVTLSCSDPIECPLLKVEPEHINMEDFVRLRCEAERGEQCHFYTDQSPEPFRTVLNRFNVCQLSATGRELLENKTHVHTTEVFLSCAAEMIVGNQRVISEQSEVKKVEVVVNFGQLHLQVDPKHISTEDDVKVRCEVEKGTRCHFYMGQSDVPFRSELYRREYRVCLLTVSGRELLQEMGNRTRAEVSLSCAVELDIKGQSVSSHHSESIRIKVEDSRISTSGSTVTTSNSVTTGIGQHLKFILPVAVVLFLLMSAAILGFHTLKHKRNKPDSKSDLEEHRNNSSELAVYATVNKEQPQTAMQLEDVDTDVCYATVKQSKHPNKSAQTLQLSQKCEYATVMMH